MIKDRVRKKSKNEEIPEIKERFVPTPVIIFEANGKRLYVRPEENPSAKALVEKLGACEMVMSDDGVYKTGTLPWALPQCDAETTVKPGDVVLCGGDRIAVCLEESSGSVTKLSSKGYVKKEELFEIFGEGDVNVKLFVEWSE